jgi:hypothetical protein
MFITFGVVALVSHRFHTQKYALIKNRKPASADNYLSISGRLSDREKRVFMGSRALRPSFLNSGK